MRGRALHGAIHVECPATFDFPSLIRSALLLLLCAAPLPADDALLTGPKFRTELDEPFTANWRSVELRDVLESIRLQRNMAILLDRRIDPNAKLPVDFAQESLEDGLANLARQFSGGVSCPDHVIYLGPEPAARKLRTLIARRRGELSNFEPPASIAKSRQQLWLKTRTVRWDDLDSPREILDRLETAWDFEIANPDLVEHDLWAAGELPDVSGVAALSLILIQFDLTFQWRDGAKVVELVPVPETVVIEKQHRPRGKSEEQTLKDWQAKYPEAEFRQAGQDILVVAPEEVHAELSAGTPKRKKPEANPALVPLARRQFTLEIRDISALDLMTRLEESGVTFEYDANELESAGVKLDRLIELNVRNLSARDFFRAVFDPLGVTVTIDGRTVTLAPK